MKPTPTAPVHAPGPVVCWHASGDGTYHRVEVPAGGAGYVSARERESSAWMLAAGRALAAGLQCDAAPACVPVAAVAADDPRESMAPEYGEAVRGG